MQSSLLVIVMQNKKKYNEAFRYIQNAININKQSGYLHQRPYIYYSYANLLLKTGDNIQAFDVAKKGINICRKTKNIQKEIELLYLNAIALTNLKMMDEAKFLLDSITPFVDSLNVKSYKQLIFEARYYWFTANKNYEKAIEYLIDIREYEKVAINEELDIKAEKLAALYKIDQYQTENLRLKDESAQQGEIIRQQNYLMLAFIIIIILTAVLIINLYLTKRKKERAAIKLQAQRDEIKKLNDSKDLFFSIIAHDLRNPIGNIINFSEFLSTNLRQGNAEHIQKAAGYIDSQSKVTLNILDNLLQWANSQRNAVSTKKDFYLLAEIIESVKNFLNGRLIEKGIALDNEIESDTLIYADRNMMEVVFRNLISNAIKYTPKNGHIKVNSSRNSKFLRINVIDNGVGIEPERLKDVFNPYKYQSTQGTEKEKGTGLA
jgi:signal transduction histidine kinase